MKSTFKDWLRTSLTAAIILIAVVLGLPAFLLLLNVPSLKIGLGDYWIVRWQNDVSGSGIEANLLFFLLAALVIGTVILLSRLWSSRRSG